ncbi:pyridine nucleotide-disulfide oxidoreductase [Frondihabitans sp. PAMC 28766]|uniref:NAD(P)/FAD-dependent oxidoreductase n=1 Tax=Frondihabitans sp. PAMC 28766 TaxID=1795630 RepID=UPI00078B2FFA|nr:NAD(P)/FAD-dependent oxidoreductase [Frondihabitans sp. PAMC 28766]AMM19949.1 pyridine nucleotide-disulfide oxidoreductase [Frondihabitans sp. PAMC 28766]
MSGTADTYDVAVVGGGPAGLSAALNLVRARRRVLLIDSNRPRNSATLMSHGFLTRDGISPLELRRLGRDEFLGYEGAEHRTTLAQKVTRAEDGYVIECAMRNKASSATARTVLAATGLHETLPTIEGLRAFYGTAIHSCIECDGYDKRDQALAVIGEHDDLAERAVLLSQWSDDLIVFTNGVDIVSRGDEEALEARGITTDRRTISSIEGDRDGLTGIRLADGDVVPRQGGFVRPAWSSELGYLDTLAPDLDIDGLLVADSHGRTSVPGLYVAGESAAPGPQQLIVAAGSGARTAATINRDLVGGIRDLADAVQ